MMKPSVTFEQVLYECCYWLLVANSTIEEEDFA